MVWWYLPGDSLDERGGAPHGFEFQEPPSGGFLLCKPFANFTRKHLGKKGIFGRRQRSPYQASMEFEIAIAPVGRRRQRLVRRSEAPRSLTTRAK
jgi:hypothetical protein